MFLMFLCQNGRCYSQTELHLEIVVRRMQDVRCMTSINPYAEEKEDFCLLTMQLWLSKSNSV